jgi:integrase/recombinase XerC
MNDLTPLAPVPIAETATADLLHTFLTGRSETTLRAYRTDLADFRVFCATPTVQEAAARLLGSGSGAANALVLRYRADLLERELTPATINRRLAALRSLVKLARLVGLVTWQLETPNVRSEAYRDTRGPGKDGVRRLLDALGTDDTPLTHRNRAILRLLYDLGLRRGEVVALDEDDVNLTEGLIYVQGKGRREKVLMTLPDPTRDALTAWRNVRGDDSGPFFTNFDRARKGDGRLSADHVYRIVRGLGERAGIKARPHGLRHTAITEACKAAQVAGIGLEEVMDFARHRNVQVLMLYRDRERNVQGKLAELVAETTAGQKDAML